MSDSLFSLFRLLLSFLLLQGCFVGSVNAGGGDTKTQNLDFIYVNANTGEAAGGHTALRMGPTVFHFQFFPQGRFQLVRDSWAHFCYVYNELRNRTVFVARLPITPQVYTRLKNHLTGLLISQQQTLEGLQDAELQLRLSTQLAYGADQLELETMGFFTLEGDEDIDMLNLHQVVLDQLGDTSFASMKYNVDYELEGLAAEPKKTNRLSWATRLKGLLLEREFLRLVEGGASLAPDVIIASPTRAPDLTPEERKVLERYREKLAFSVVELLQSNRPDRAVSLMLQTARYMVVSRALATGRLLTLDPFSSSAVSVSVEKNDDLHRVSGQLKKVASQARNDFFKETEYPDIAYTLLETSQGRSHEVERSIFTGSRVRVEAGMLLPARNGKVSLTGLSFVKDDLRAVVIENKAGVAKLRQQLANQYGYDLTRRNCATELLRAIYSAFPGKETVRRELGGWLDPENGLLFIPNRFYALVSEHFLVQEEKILLSRRLRRMEELYGSGEVLSVWLRESNTLSSTLYESRTDDTPFLFFTDDALLLRPIFGATNFCWAALNGVSGVFTLPMDGGERIKQGLRGMFYSLPELAFSNIRKGTYGVAGMVTTGP